MRLYRVVLSFAVFGFEADSHVRRVAPIAKYALGWPLEKALAYFRSRGKVQEV